MRFEIGDIAIIAYAVSFDGFDYEPYRGAEVEISGGLALRMWSDGVARYCYNIEHPDFKSGLRALPKELRKKEPPQEELGSWEEIQKITERPNKAGWNPTKIREPAGYRYTKPMREVK